MRQHNCRFGVYDNKLSSWYLDMDPFWVKRIITIVHFHAYGFCMDVIDTFHRVTAWCDYLIDGSHTSYSALSAVAAPSWRSRWRRRAACSVDSGGDIVKVRTKNYDELGHSEHSALEFSNVDISNIHKIPSRCLLSPSPGWIGLSL